MYSNSFSYSYLYKLYCYTDSCIRIIAALPKFIEPILDAIGEYTGWKASFIAGGPEPADGGRLNMIRYDFVAPVLLFIAILLMLIPTVFTQA